jgi:pimeloyl-ACP methyl ester carboxylesterase
MKIPTHFLVIVPGFMGSKLRDKMTGEIIWVDFSSIPLNPFEWDKWIENLFSKLVYPNDNLEPDGIMDEVLFLPPWAKQEHYGRLIRLFESMGYKVDPAKYTERELDVYVFAYDWRQDNRVSARQLAEAVERWNSFHPKSKVWILAHSNGGIISRWYIEKEGGKDKVGRLFLMGSPWDGAPKAFQIMFSGLDILFRWRFNLFNIPVRTRDILRTFPSAYQLIPAKNPFLRDLYNERVDPFTDMTWLGDEGQQKLLLDGRRFDNELGTNLSVETLCFFGRKLPTVSSGLVRFAAGGNWRDIKWEATESGDGTVPEHSAVFLNAQTQYPFCVNHGDIYVNPAVLEVLEWELFGKYLLSKRATLINAMLSITFEADHDNYRPGDTIKISISIHKNNFESPPLPGVQIQARLVWRQALPGMVVISGPPQDLPETGVVESEPLPGYYIGQLIAPEFEGYYAIRAVVMAPGHPPLLLEELIMIESIDDNYL